MGARILIVDDDESIRKLIQTVLTAAGYEVTVAKNGAEGVALFPQCDPEIVLLDVMMPGMDGFQCCDAIRKLPGGEGIPVAFLTAHGDARSNALDHGPNDFLTKPISSKELLARIGHLETLKRKADAIR